MKTIKNILIIIILLLLLGFIGLIGLKNNWFKKEKIIVVNPGTIICTKIIQEKKTDILGIKYDIYFYYNENNKVTKTKFETTYDFQNDSLAKKSYDEILTSKKDNKNVSISKNILKHWTIKEINEEDYYDKDKKIEVQRNSGYKCEELKKETVNNQS